MSKLFAFFVAFMPITLFAADTATNVNVDVWLMGVLASFMGSLSESNLTWVLLAFAAINAISNALTTLIMKTETKKDDVILGKLNKVLSFVRRILDLVTANTRR
jgi:hypothetical protein